MNRAVFDDAIAKLVEHCEESAPTKALSLIFVAIALIDSESLKARGNLCSAQELHGVINIALAKIRSACGTNGATPVGGVQA